MPKRAGTTISKSMREEHHAGATAERPYNKLGGSIGTHPRLVPFPDRDGILRHSACSSPNFDLESNLQPWCDGATQDAVPPDCLRQPCCSKRHRQVPPPPPSLPPSPRRIAREGMSWSRHVQEERAPVVQVGTQAGTTKKSVGPGKVSSRDRRTIQHQAIRVKTQVERWWTWKFIKSQMHTPQQLF